MILYTIDCPKCKILKKKLDDKNIKYDMCTDIKVIQDKGYMYLPVLEVEGKGLDFSAAVKYVNEL